jgi:hypothetical protein
MAASQGLLITFGTTLAVLYLALFGVAHVLSWRDARARGASSDADLWLALVALVAVSWIIARLIG